MKVNRPGSPLSSGAEPLEPLDPQELRETVKGERFAAALSQLEAQATGAGGQTAGTSSAARNALAQIAAEADLATNEGALTAVRSSARYMIRSRLNKKFSESEQADTLVEDLSEYVASDPLLKSKLLMILQRIKAA
jgi:gamma-glutamyl:cysteine ligase YbdK (ATP-grasp superfamily)